MQKIPVVAIFDVGKTNKKLFLLDEDYQIVYEKSARFKETVDEDGEPCESLENLRQSVFDCLQEVLRYQKYDIKAINFSAYGASLVYIDGEGKPLCALYSYLKAYPEQLQRQFYSTYGGEKRVSKETASPVLASLNSGLQIYRLKHERPELFKKVKFALHLPQYLSCLLSGQPFSDITSIGCHTSLWNFDTETYHTWVEQEGVLEKLAPLVSSDTVVPASFLGKKYAVGVGLHDSSAALIPYLVSFHEPFALISTGTWCITLNPFNTIPLTESELEQDCLCYMHYRAKSVKASRFFGGYLHEQEVKRIAAYFNQEEGFYKSVAFNPEILDQLQSEYEQKPETIRGLSLATSFAQKDLAAFSSAEEAYHQLMYGLVKQQVESTQLVVAGTSVQRIFVDGGFSKNAIYMNLLAHFYPEKEIFAASMAQATALGTALAIHSHWNTKPLPNDLIELKYYAVTHDAKL